MNSYLETNMLSKKYGSHYAVKNMSIHVKKGDIYGLIGPNGAGKTTLMKMIAGFSTPTEGDINLFDGDYRHRRIGCLIENPGLYGNMNAFENMKLKAIAMGVYDKKEILRILDFVGLSETKRKKTKYFSLGMKQRLGIGLALIGNPDFLILDEPINGLDPQGILEIREMLMKLNKEQNLTIMISSHILEELHKVANIFGIIADGELITEFTKEELAEKCCERVEIVTKHIQACAAALESMGIFDYSVRNNNTIYAYGCTNQVASITKHLILEDIQIESIGTYANSLEEFFLETVKGGKQ